MAMAQQNDSEFPLPTWDKYYLVDSGYPNKQEFLAPYRSSRNGVVRYHMSQFNSGPAPRNKQELFNCVFAFSYWENIWILEEKMADCIWFSKIQNTCTKKSGNDYPEIT